MKRVTLYLILFILSIYLAPAQQFKWVKGGGSIDDVGPGTASGGSYVEASYYMCTDPNGNIYSLNIVGDPSIRADTFSGTGYGTSNNLLVTSYNCFGQMRWAKLLTSRADESMPYGIIADTTGNIYIAGWLRPGPLKIGYDTLLPTYTQYNVGLVKLDTLGHFQWIRFVGNNTTTTHLGTGIGGQGLTTLCMDGINNVHLLTYVKSNIVLMPGDTSHYGVYDMTYNSAGSLLSAVRMDMDSQWYISGAVIDPATNKIYTYGQINQTIYGGFLTDTFFAAAFDASRHRLWQYFCGNDTCGQGLGGIVMDKTRHLSFCAAAATNILSIPTTFKFNGMSVTSTIYPSKHMSLIMQTDTNGHPIWMKKFESSRSVNTLASITLLPNGKIGSAGLFTGVVTDGINSISLVSGQDPYMVIVDSTGDLQTMEHIYGDGFYDAAYFITSDKVGNIYLGGQVEDSIWAGTPPIPAYTTNGGNTDFFVMKYGVDCSCTAMPAAAFSYTGTVTVSANYTGTTAGMDSVVWTFGDGASSRGTTALHTYTAAGTYHLCVTVYTNCGHDSDCTTIRLPCLVPPVAAFTKSGSRVLTTTYTGTTIGMDSVVWTFGDGTSSRGTTAMHTYTAIGVYQVCAIAYSPCGNDTVCRYDTVWCLTATVCSFTDTGSRTLAITYTGTTAGTDSVVAWYGDGSHTTGYTGMHTYTSAGIFHVCVVAYSHCGNDTSCIYDTIPCVAPPHAAFTDTGAITHGLIYTGTTTGLDSVAWTYGDGVGDTGRSLVHTYSATGTYHVCLIAYNPCGIDTLCRDILVCDTAPRAAFTHTGISNISFTYTGSTTGLDSVVWTYGDGHIGHGLAPTHTYTASGIYLACATVYTNCGSDSACQSLTIRLVGVAVQIIEGIQTYPNPVRETLYISVLTTNASYRILDIAGQNLSEGKLSPTKNTITVKDFVPGIYILELTLSDGIRNVVRVVKE